MKAFLLGIIGYRAHFSSNSLARLLFDMSSLRIEIMFAQLCKQPHNEDSICFNICNELSQVTLQVGKLKLGMGPWLASRLLQRNLPIGGWKQSWHDFGNDAKREEEGGKKPQYLDGANIPNSPEIRWASWKPEYHNLTKTQTPYPPSFKSPKNPASSSHSFCVLRTSYFALKKWMLTSLYIIRENAQPRNKPPLLFTV